MTEKLTIHARNVSRFYAGEVLTEPFAAIPQINIAALQQRDAQAKQQVADQIRMASLQVGFFYVTGHRVDPGIQARASDAAKCFFCPGQGREKQGIGQELTPDAWLWRALGRKHKSDNHGDLHEHFYLALDFDPDDPDCAAGTYGCGPNQWPDMSNFLAPGMAYHGKVVRLADVLFGGFALSRGLARERG